MARDSRQIAAAAAMLTESIQRDMSPSPVRSKKGSREDVGPRDGGTSSYGKQGEAGGYTTHICRL